MQIAPLPPVALPAARTLLGAALPFDHLDLVVEEKLFGDNGARVGRTLGAWVDDVLVGVAAAAGRWIKLIAVDAQRRRQQIGSALLAELRVHAPAEARLRVGDHPGNYLSPGIDDRYHEGRAFFAARGFVEVGIVENLRAPLDRPLPALEVSGYIIRRAEPVEGPRLRAWIAHAFAPVWGFEVARAIAGPRRAVHVAWQGTTPVAFAAADGNNQGLGWFGPAGTLPEHRGRRLGEALLWRCLEDVRGLPDAGVIAWIGPKEFYRKTVGAVEDRRFVQLEER